MNEDPSSRGPRDKGGAASSTDPAAEQPRGSSFWGRLKGLYRQALGRPANGEQTVRETLEELIEDGEEPLAPLNSHQRLLLTNILHLREITAYDVMVPRADIVAIEDTAGLTELIELTSRKTHSRLPVYRGTLDEVIGMVHIKDVLAASGRPRSFRLPAILRKPLFVAPSMPALDLLLEMRLTHTHMALVVDEYGGIDGLVTIEDVVEEIVGDIQDEHDTAPAPVLRQRADGDLDADARVPLEEVEALIGSFLTEEEREEDIDTLGGLVFRNAGRVPARGECIAHPSGIELEVMEADPRRIKRVHVRIPDRPAANGGDAAGGNAPADHQADDSGLDRRRHA